MDKPTCKTCPFFGIMPAEKIGDSNFPPMKQCRMKAPSVDNHPVHPTVDEDHFCGDHPDFDEWLSEK
jgi:hypothetical protein